MLEASVGEVICQKSPRETHAEPLADYIEARDSLGPSCLTSEVTGQ
jgi:hypothetical protein